MEFTNTADPAGQNGENSTNGEVTATSTQAGEKVFTQSQLEEILKGRLKKYEDYDNLKAFKETAEREKMSELDVLKQDIDRLTPLAKRAEEAEATIATLLEKQLSTIPDNMKKLIPSTFSPIEKLRYIEENADVFTVALPNMPRDPNPRSPKAGLYGGKYASLEEFASKDPRGYSSWRKSSAGQFTN